MIRSTAPVTAASVRQIALGLLARREHSRFELEQKLLKRGVGREHIRPELDRLVDEGWLSDARYLEALIRRRALAGYGPYRIRDELLKQGIPAADIAEALQQSEFDWLAVLQSVWCRKYAGCLPQNAQERAQQARFLTYRGFPMELLSRLWRSKGQVTED